MMNNRPDPIRSPMTSMLAAWLDAELFIRTGDSSCKHSTRLLGGFDDSPSRRANAPGIALEPANPSRGMEGSTAAGSVVGADPSNIARGDCLARAEVPGEKKL